MGVARSRVTSQGQISVPAEIRRLLGVGPGSVLEWEDIDGEIIVRRGGSVTSVDIHDAVFPEGKPARKSLADLKEGLRKHARDKHARG